MEEFRYKYTTEYIFSHQRKVEFKSNFNLSRKVEGNSNFEKNRRKQQSKWKEIAILKINTKVEGNSNFEIALFLEKWGKKWNGMEGNSNSDLTHGNVCQFKIYNFHTKSKLISFMN